MKKLRSLLEKKYIEVLASIVLISFIGWQSCSIRQQTDIISQSFTLEKRPYLYVEVNPYIKGNNEVGTKALFAGVEMIYKNEGLITASNIKTEVKIGCDTNLDFYDIPEWYEKEYGSYPYVTTVFPKQEVPAVFTPSLAYLEENGKRHVYAGIRIFYNGSSEKGYFYGVDCIYIMENLGQNEFSYTLLKYDTWCDMNVKEMPEIRMPDWEGYPKAEKMKLSTGS